MYVIAGVSGHFGAKAAELMLERVPASELVFTTRDVAGARRWAELGVDVRYADYDDVEATTRAFTGGDVLLLISGFLVGPLRRAQHLRAVEVAKTVGIERVVYTSYLGAGDEKQQEAIVTIDHRATEQAILASGMSWNFLRDSQYGEAMAEQAAAAALIEGRFIGNQGDGKVAFVSRDDCVRVAVELLLGGGERDRAYDVTGPELLTYTDVAALVSEISGRDIPYVDVSDEEFYAQWDAIGVPRSSDGDFSNSPFPWCSDDMVSFGRGIREGEMEVITDVVEQLTGRAPVPLRELMVRASADWPTP